MKKLLVLGSVAMAVGGYALKRWYDKTKMENPELDNPVDVAEVMLDEVELL